MINKKDILLVIILILFTGCSIKEYKLFQEDTLKDKATEISEREYKEEIVFENKIASNDRVSIMVYIQSGGTGSQQMTSMLSSRNNNNPLTEDNEIGLLVTQKGTVRLPLLGTVKIIGLTEDEASEKLISMYKKYIRNPYITTEIKNQRVIVIGEVKRPGIVPVTNGTMNIIEAIARSGDLTDFASRNNIQIIRGDLRNPIVRNIDLSQISAMQVSSLYLQPNDIIYVQPRDMKGINKALTELAPFGETLSSLLNPFVQRKILLD